MVTETHRRTGGLRLPRAVYVLQAGLVLNALGNGAAAPFLVIYLHDVRGVSLALSGLAGATGACSALVSSLAAGSVGDRVGARPTMVGGLLLSSTAYLLYPLVRQAWEALALAVVAGAGSGTWLTMQSSFLAAIVPRELRHTAFAQQRVVANLGLGLGGFAGGLLVSAADPATFTRLFLFNAATFLLYIGFVLRLPQTRAERGAAKAVGYRGALADRPFRRLTHVHFLLVAGGVSLLPSLFPVFAHNHAHASERAIGLLFLLNSLLIVVAQLPIAKAHEGHRRAMGLAATAVLFASTWLLVLGSASLDPTAAIALLVLAVLVFGLGECLYDTVFGPLVSDLAPEAARGRYMAVGGFAWQLGFIAGPGLGGLLLTAGGAALWLPAAAVCIVGGLAAVRLDHELPDAYRTTPK